MRIISRAGFAIILSILSVSLGWQGHAQNSSKPSKLEELLAVLRTNLPNLSEEQLNAAAVNGLVEQLAGQVIVDGSPASTEPKGAALKQSNLFDGAYGYVRVSRVTEKLTDEFSVIYMQWKSSNSINGLIIDLRFAGGTDYAAAAKMAGMFQTEERPLLDFGEGMIRSQSRADAFTGPVVVLVNQSTQGAAEALAAILRQTETALLIGSPTSASARLYKEFTLSSGQKIKIATTQIKLGDGKPLPSRSITPDINVAVTKENEKAWFEDAYRFVPQPGLTNLAASAPSNTNSSATATNRQPRRLNEAELVRLLKEGRNPDFDTTDADRPEKESGKPVIRDPALARALDLLKGLAVVQHQKRTP